AVKILHVLDHSFPHVDGYSIRSHHIILEEKRRGLEVVVVTSPKHGRSVASVEETDGIRFYRTPQGRTNARIPFVGEVFLMARLFSRIREVARVERVDLVHAHSPSLNGIPAYLVARGRGLPVVYEMRSLWEERPEGQGLTVFESSKVRISRW